MVDLAGAAPLRGVAPVPRRTSSGQGYKCGRKFISEWAQLLVLRDRPGR